MVSHKTSEKKPAVILDIGTAFTKAGYAGDDVPICIIPSKLKEVKCEKWLRDVKSQDELRVVLRSFLRHLYLRELLVSMGERPVIVCESLLCTEMWKKTLAQVLLIDFEVPSVTFAPRHLLSLYTLGITTALVVHSGYSETVAIPIYENMVLLNAWQSLLVGGKAIEENLDILLGESAHVEVSGERQPLQKSGESLSQRQLEDIKVRTCFVTRHDRAKLWRQAKLTEEDSKPSTPQPPPDVIYPLNGDTILHIPGKVRETACEVLYNSDKEQTLARLLLDCIVKCPVDTRRKLAGNIVLIGGNCAMTGFKHRLQQELLELSQSPPYSDKMSIHSFAFHKLTVKENYTAWLGGAILGACSRLEPYALTRSAFESQNESVPDWSNFIPDVDVPTHDRTL